MFWLAELGQICLYVELYHPLCEYYIFRQKLFHDAELDILQWLLEFRPKLRVEKWICKKRAKAPDFTSGGIFSEL